MMEIKPIHSKKDYEEALARIDVLMDADDDEEELKELDALTTLVVAYEKKHFPIEPLDPIDVIKFRMEQMGFTNVDLAAAIHCSRGRVSEVLNKRRPLSLNMIRTISKEMDIPVELLVKEYETTQSLTKR